MNINIFGACFAAYIIVGWIWMCREVHIGRFYVKPTFSIKAVKCTALIICILAILGYVVSDPYIGVFIGVLSLAIFRTLEYFYLRQLFKAVNQGITSKEKKEVDEIWKNKMKKFMIASILCGIMILWIILECFSVLL